MAKKAVPAVPKVAAPQVAAARRGAEGELAALVEKHAPEHVGLVGVVRRWLRKRLPSAHEVGYDYRDAVVISFSPSEKGYEGVFAIRASASGVQLYFNRGKGLADPGKLLKGSAKLVRWIPVEGAGTLRRAEVVALVEAAMARNEVPFEEGGRGSVVIR